MVQAIIEIELVLNQTFLFSIQDKQEKRCQYDSKPGFLFCEQYLQFIFNLELINTSFSEKEGTLCAIFFQSLTKFNWWYSPPPTIFFWLSIIKIQVSWAILIRGLFGNFQDLHSYSFRTKINYKYSYQNVNEDTV